MADKETVNTSVKLSAEDVERLDALIAPMAIAARDVGSSVSRTSIIRAAILRGLEELEKRFLGASKQPPKPWENQEP